VLEHILGLDDNTRDRVHLIEYLSGLGQVVSDVAAGKYQVAFLLNPTQVEQVRKVAQAGLIMPRKATYFFPKVITGLTLNLLSPFESIAVSA